MAGSSWSLVVAVIFAASAGLTLAVVNQPQPWTRRLRHGRLFILKNIAASAGLTRQNKTCCLPSGLTLFVVVVVIVASAGLTLAPTTNLHLGGHSLTLLAPASLLFRTYASALLGTMVGTLVGTRPLTVACAQSCLQSTLTSFTSWSSMDSLVKMLEGPQNHQHQDPSTNTYLSCTLHTNQPKKGRQGTHYSSIMG